MLPVVLLFLCACGTQKQTVEMSSEVYELPQNCEELTVTADVGSVFIQKGEKAELKTEHVVSQWLTVTEENGVVTVSYIPPDEKAVEGMDTDSHHLTLTLPEDWMPEKAALTARERTTVPEEKSDTGSVSAVCACRMTLYFW